MPLSPCVLLHVPAQHGPGCSTTPLPTPSCRGRAGGISLPLAQARRQIPSCACPSCSRAGAEHGQQRGQIPAAEPRARGRWQRLQATGTQQGGKALQIPHQEGLQRHSPGIPAGKSQPGPGRRPQLRAGAPGASRWGEAPQVLEMWEGILVEIGADQTPENPHGGTALRVWGVWEEIQPELTPEKTSEDPHWRETLQVWRVWAGIHRELKPEQTPENPHWGEAL